MGRRDRACGLFCGGRILIVAAPDHVQAILDALHALLGGEGAVQIRRVAEGRPGTVVLRTSLSGIRILVKLTGAQLPRSC